MTHDRVFPLLELRTGEVAGSAEPKQLPERPCQAVRIKAVRANTGNVYIGTGGVRAVESADNDYAGWELDAGEETPWLFIRNLDQLWMIGTTAADDIVFFYYL